jgi:hypothetical protein
LHHAVARDAPRRRCHSSPKSACLYTIDKKLTTSLVRCTHITGVFCPSTSARKQPPRTCFVFHKKICALALFAPSSSDSANQNRWSSLFRRSCPPHGKTGAAPPWNPGLRRFQGAGHGQLLKLKINFRYFFFFSNYKILTSRFFRIMYLQLLLRIYKHHLFRDYINPPSFLCPSSTIN